jgi:hypothetical protein
LLPALIVMSAAGPAIPVAVNVAGVNAPAEADNVFAPEVVPSVQVPAVAIPLALVVAVAPVMPPPPLATANVTVVPETGLLFTSVTFTDGAVVTAAPTIAVCPLPATILIAPAEPAVPVALNVTGDPVNDPDVAVSVFAPAADPSVHDPTVAIPDAFVVAFAPVTLPPPVATAKVTDTPATPLPLASVTLTDGTIATADPAAAS